MKNQFEYVITTKKNNEFEFKLAQIENIYPLEVFKELRIINDISNNNITKVLNNIQEIKGINYVYEYGGNIAGLINIEHIGDISYIKVKQYTTKKLLSILVKSIDGDAIIYGKITCSDNLNKGIDSLGKALTSNTQVMIIEKDKCVNMLKITYDKDIQNNNRTQNIDILIKKYFNK